MFCSDKITTKKLLCLLLKITNNYKEYTPPRISKSAALSLLYYNIGLLNLDIIEMKIKPDIIIKYQYPNYPHPPTAVKIIITNPI